MLPTGRNQVVMCFLLTPHSLYIHAAQLLPLVILGCHQTYIYTRHFCHPCPGHCNKWGIIRCGKSIITVAQSQQQQQELISMIVPPWMDSSHWTSIARVTYPRSKAWQ